MSAIVGMGRGLCAGQPQLFDSTDPEDHARARALCEACPALVACAAALHEARTATNYAAPVGTWAGQLMTGNQNKHRRQYKAWKDAS